MIATPTDRPARRRPARIARPRGLRRVRPLLLGAAVAAAAWFALDGPLFVAPPGPVPAPTPEHARLEQRFAPVLDDTEVVIVDTDRLRSRAAVEAYVAHQLNARGLFVNAAWSGFIDRVFDPDYGARAIYRQFLGGSHGAGLAGYLRRTGVCVVTTGPEARALAAATGMAPAFWSRLVLVHELQHCVDAARGNLAAPGTMATAAPGQAAAGDGVRGSPAISGRELYADAATALFLLRDGTPPAALQRFAELRTRPVRAALADRRLPVWSHFTGPMLAAILDDVRAGRLNPAALGDDALHARASAYRERALAQAEEVSLARLQAALRSGSGVRAALRKAGAPAGWLTGAGEPAMALIDGGPGHAHTH